jgi:hypothetical protein
MFWISKRGSQIGGKQELKRASRELDYLKGE